MELAKELIPDCLAGDKNFFAKLNSAEYYLSSIVDEVSPEKKLLNLSLAGKVIIIILIFILI